MLDRVMLWVRRKNDENYRKINKYHKNSFPGGSVVKNLPANVEDVGLVPGLGRSPAEVHINLFQYSYLGNPNKWSLGGYSPWGHTRVTHDLVTKQQKTSIKCLLCVHAMSHFISYNNLRLLILSLT